MNRKLMVNKLATLGRFHSQTTPVYSEEKTLAVSKNTLLFKPYDSLRSLEATNSGNIFQELYFPAQILVERWKNVRGQLSFLAASLSCTYPRVGFPELSPKISSFESVAVKLDEAYSSTWAAIPLIDILLELAETEHYVAVRLIFDIPLKHCPETLLLSLACGSPRWNEMYRELLHILFQMFFDNHPNFMPVARKLYSIHPSLLEYGIIEAWKRNPSCLTRILDVCQDLKIVPEILQHSEYYEFSNRLGSFSSTKRISQLGKVAKRSDEGKRA
eukprot:jgi/Galph1/2889/GphlegSOOS_G1570.1